VSDCAPVVEKEVDKTAVPEVSVPEPIEAELL
jgi:hypothetical protein